MEQALIADIAIYTVSAISLIAGLILLIVHFCDKKLHKNPCKDFNYFSKLIRYR
jgi:hypothetical protein